MSDIINQLHELIRISRNAYISTLVFYNFLLCFRHATRVIFQCDRVNPAL